MSGHHDKFYREPEHKKSTWPSTGSHIHGQSSVMWTAEFHVSPQRGMVAGQQGSPGKFQLSTHESSQSYPQFWVLGTGHGMPIVWGLGSHFTCQSDFQQRKCSSISQLVFIEYVNL